MVIELYDILQKYVLTLQYMTFNYQIYNWFFFCTTFKI